MATPIQANYDQTFLFPPALEDWIPADHPARFVRDFVRVLDLPSLGFRAVFARNGRAAFAPELLLSLWLYGYLEKLRSSRRVEWATYNHHGMMWLAGGYHPDHNTLSTFFRDHRTAIKRLFTQLVKAAAHLDLIGLLVHALDGTKLQAACSKRGALHQDRLLKEWAQLEAAVEELLQQTEQADQQEAGEVRLPAALADAQARLTAVREALQQLAAAETKHLQPQEPDARMMKGGDGRVTFAYNAQAVRDASSGLVVACDVVMEAADNALLPPMLDQVEATVGAVAEETLADGGYQSGAVFDTLETQARSVLVNLEAAGAAAPADAFAKERFTWAPDVPQYVCPRGQILAFAREKTKKRKRDGSPYRVEVYRCAVCAACPDRAQCTTSPTGRTVERTAYDDAFQRQRKKQRLSDNRFLLQQRGSIIERLFGEIKQTEGFRRFTVAGLEAVQAQWALMCLTVNLKRLYQWWTAGRFTMAQLAAAVQMTVRSQA